MSTVVGQLGLSASLRWKQENAVTGFSSSQQGDSLDFNVAPAAGTYQEILATQFTLAAAASQTIDLRSFVNLFGVTITATKVLAIILTAAGSTGQLKIAPGASNAINFWFSGTTPAITLDCGTDGCCILLGGGSSKTVDATHRNIDVTNPGAASITVRAAAFLGT